MPQTVWTFLAVVGIACSALAEGPPWKRHAVDTTSRGADGVRLADVNHDGRPDITTGWEEGGRISVYLHPGPELVRKAWPAVTVGEVKSPEDAVFADLDADGFVDVVSSCEGKTQSIFFHWAPASADDYLSQTAWKTAAVPATADKSRWMFALPLQLDGQNGIDVVVGSKEPGATVGWLRSPADARNAADWTFHPLYRAGWIMSLIARDFDGDGDLDVLLSDRKGKTRGISWLENPGASAVAAERRWPLHRLAGEDREVMFLTVGDVDQDGRDDILCAVKGGNLLWLQATGDANHPFQPHEIAMPENCGSGKGVAIGDVNNDGRNDIVFSCEHADGNKSGVRWLRYRQSPAAKLWDDFEISGPQGVKFDRLELLDLDEDGDLDVLTCEERDNLGVIWYENPAQ